MENKQQDLEQQVHDALYRWNDAAEVKHKDHYICDESLRDGVQDPEVTEPNLAQKLEFIAGLEQIGVSRVCLGFPASSEKAYEETLEMTRFINQQGFNIEPYCAARSMVSDIEPIAKIQQAVGCQLGVTAFIGISPIRRIAEKWSENFVLEQSVKAVSYGLSEGIDVNFVTEDTTRSTPELIKTLLEEVRGLGCRRFTLCDTVGQATPSGVNNLVRYVRSLKGLAQGEAKLEWHGHNDRGLSLSNGLHAWMAGCDGVHGTLLGIGERAGNTPVELLLLNQMLESEITSGASNLVSFIKSCSQWFNRNIDDKYPLVGSSVFTTVSGVHAAAIIKSYAQQNNKLADLVYSSVPASVFGLEQDVKINNTSGRSNIVYWAKKNQVELDESCFNDLLSYAKTKRHTLENDEIRHFLDKNLKEQDDVKPRYA